MLIKIFCGNRHVLETNTQRRVIFNKLHWADVVDYGPLSLAESILALGMKTFCFQEENILMSAL